MLLGLSTSTIGLQKVTKFSKKGKWLFLAKLLHGSDDVSSDDLGTVCSYFYYHICNFMHLPTNFKKH